MAHIPIRPRQGVPPWVWLLSVLVVLLIALILVDYFVTNFILGPRVGQGPRDPFSAALELEGARWFAMLMPSTTTLR